MEKLEGGVNKMAKRKKNLRRVFGYSMTMGGAALISGKLPAVAGAPVKSIATTGSKFVAPMAAATGAGMVIEMLPKPKKRRKR